jgi:hypothetical protein
MNGKRLEDTDIMTDETTMHLEETQNSMGLVTLDEINE